MASFKNSEELANAIRFEDNDTYHFDGPLEGGFGVCLSREYTKESLSGRFYCRINFIVYREEEDSPRTPLVVRIDIHTKPGTTQPELPIIKKRNRPYSRFPAGLEFDDFCYDHPNCLFLKSGKPISSEKLLNMVWEYHLAPTLLFRSAPFRTKKLVWAIINHILSLLVIGAEKFLKNVLGIELTELKLENFFYGYKNSQMKLGDAETFELLGFKAKKRSVVIWCLLLCSLSLVKSEPPMFSGILSNSTFGLAWGIILMWGIDWLLPRIALKILNSFIRLNSWFLWRMGKLRKILWFYV